MAILDLSMRGGLSGIETCRAVRAGPLAAGAPIIRCTASAHPGYREACRAAGADAFLATPYRPTTLLALARSRVPALAAVPVGAAP